MGKSEVPNLIQPIYKKTHKIALVSNKKTKNISKHFAKRSFTETLKT